MPGTEGSFGLCKSGVRFGGASKGWRASNKTPPVKMASEALLTKASIAITIRRRCQRALASIWGQAQFLQASEATMEEATAGKPMSQVEADIVNLSGGAIDTVEGESVSITKGGARRVVGSEVTMSQSGAASIQAEKVEMHLSAAVAVRGEEVSLDEGGAGIVIADTVRGNQSRSGVVIADHAEMQGGSSVILLAREVNGDVETMVDTRGALLAGLAAGAAMGTILLIARLLTKRR
jgi:hypothetical protein